VDLVPGIALRVRDRLAARAVEAGVRPDRLTTSALAFAAMSAVAILIDALPAGALLFAAAGLCDALDGEVARLTGSTSAAGEFRDAMFDRAGELMVFGAVAIHFAHEPIALATTLAALAGASLTSYARARAAASRVDLASVGPVQRPVRVAALSAGMLPGFDPLLFGVMVILAAAGCVTAILRARAARIELSLRGEPRDHVVPSSSMR
jgi:phosphatidylglycerophosphate synthase